MRFNSFRVLLAVIGIAVGGAAFSLSLVALAQDAPPDPTICGEGVVYTVQPNDSLYGIVNLFDTNIDVLLAANNITIDTTIRPGQTLNVPCAPTPTPTIIPATPTPGVVVITPTAQQRRRAQRRNEPAPQTVTVDCAPFRATAPLDGLAVGENTFYWDPAPGAQGYSILVFNYDFEGGEVVASGGGGADATSTVINMGVRQVGGGFVYGFQIYAVALGQVVCRTPVYNVLRVPPRGRN